MKAEDLMIGDLVKFPHGIDKVRDLPYVSGKGICASFAAFVSLFPEPVEMLEPIPLTAEILEKNFKEFLPGLNVLYGLGGPYIASLEEEGWIFGLVKKDGIGRYPLVKINYVHELQHALKLCGIDLKIEL